MLNMPKLVRNVGDGGGGFLDYPRIRVMESFNNPRLVPYPPGVGVRVRCSSLSTPCQWQSGCTSAMHDRDMWRLS